MTIKFRSPFPPPEGFAREVLTIIAEECAEVAQRCTKALRFGLTEIEPGHERTNAWRIGLEFGDLVAIMSMAQRYGLVPSEAIEDGEAEKRVRLVAYMQTEPPGSNGR